MKIINTLQGEKLWGAVEKKSQEDGTPEKYLKKKKFLNLKVPISKAFKNGQILWKGVFCGKFHSVEKITFGKNKIHSCDSKKQRIPHIKKNIPLSAPQNWAIGLHTLLNIMQGQSLAVIISFM